MTSRHIIYSNDECISQSQSQIPTALGRKKDFLKWGLVIVEKQWFKKMTSSSLLWPKVVSSFSSKLQKNKKKSNYLLTT